MTIMTSMDNSALVIVDVQNDFVSGSLPVNNAENIITAINKLVKKHKKKFSCVILSKDWHPKEHSSFIEYGGLWPEHCVQFTFGAEIDQKLKIPEKAVFVYKGINKDHECYSIFRDEIGNENKSLIRKLRRNRIKNIYVCGFAFEYCVLSTAVDASSLGFRTYILSDCTGYINNDLLESIDILMKENIQLATIHDL